MYHEALEITFEPIEMYIASKYKPGTCEYNATKDHETDTHYQDHSILVREFQPKMKEAGLSALLPSKEQPWYVRDKEEGDRLMNAAVYQTFKPLTSELAKRGKAKADERDTPATYEAVMRQCSNWEPEPEP